MDDQINHHVGEDCEEHSFCNCENSEQITPYLRDDCDCFDKAAEAVAEKCKQMKDCCEEKLKDVTRGKKNPYFKQSWALQTDVYRSIEDTEPTDRLMMKNSYAFSLRAIALICGAIGTFWFLKKLLSREDEV
jgi:hypothetical protein